MSHSFVAGAETEYLDAIRFYDDKRAGLGAPLIDEFERVIRLAVAVAVAVYYRVLPNGEVQVMAFAHHRRSPGYWLVRTGV